MIIRLSVVRKSSAARSVLTQMQLHVLHLHLGNLAVFGQQTGRIHRVLHEIVGDLQEQLFNLLVQLLGRIDFAHQLLQTRLGQDLNGYVGG